MICPAAIGLKAHFGDEGISFVMLTYDRIVYPMYPFGFEASRKSELCIRDK